MKTIQSFLSSSVSGALSRTTPSSLLNIRTTASCPSVERSPTVRRRTIQRTACHSDRPALFSPRPALRTSSAAAAEDERDLSKVYSKKEYFEALVKGYLAQAKFLTEAEKANLAFSGRLITFTIGIRFLADYLAGDTYFRTAYPEHNLVRCRTQFKMVESMEAQADEYEAIVRKYC